MRSKSLSRDGFTLLEILVILILLGLLIGAVVPNVLNQASRGEVTRILRDITAVEAGAKHFRVDVSRWPGALGHLQTRPATSDADVHGTPYPQGLLNRWDGPYLESVEVTQDSLATAGGGMIYGFVLGDSANAYQLNGQDYLVVSIHGLAPDDLTALDLEVDGDTGVATGRLRTASSTAFYLAAPLQ